VDSLDADILVIQECEDPKRSSEVYRSWAGEHLWAGKDKNKGIGVFARKGNTIRKLEWKGEYRHEVINNNSEATSWNSEELQSFLPLIVNETHTLLAVWLKHAGSKYFGYIGQMWKYLQIHKQDLAINDKNIICGDLNSNAQWDAKDRWWNHTDVVRELEEIGIHSLYHHIEKEAHSKETKKTFYMYRRINNPKFHYHIDHVFLSENLLASSSIRIYEPENWIQYSDHVPVEFIFNG
jgi:exodeoxyribonuclease-3